MPQTHDSGGSARPLAVCAQHLTRVIGARANQTVILDDVSFDVPAGSLFAISGPSGSGKSTLLHLLTGIDRPTRGRVVFGGEELRAKSEDALARWRGKRVGIIFQFFQLLPTLTAYENVLLALALGRALKRSQWRARAMTCLELAHIAHRASHLPSELSGGEQQRVALARALANDPPVIVADEPTGNLDSRTATAVFETLASLTRLGKTVIYVTHARELAARADDSIALLDGRRVNRQDFPVDLSAAHGARSSVEGASA